MNYRKFLFPIILLFVFTLVNHSQAITIPGLEEYELGGEEGWEFKKDKRNIKCYTRPVKISPMISFRGVGDVKGKMSDMVSFLMDIERYPEWMYMNVKSYILDKTGETEAYVYTLLQPPWPASQRDITVRRQWYYLPETGAVIITIKGLPDYVPKRDKTVRGSQITAYYMLVPKGDNTIEVTYEGIADPGGWLPVWLVNFCVVYTPYSTIKKIRMHQPYEGYSGTTWDFMKARLTVKNNPGNDNEHSETKANSTTNDYKGELEKQLRKVTYDKIKRYYFESHPYGVQGSMKCYVSAGKGCPDADIQVQTVDDYQWSNIASFKIKSENNKGNAIAIPDALLSRKSHTPGGIAFGINGNGENRDGKLSGKVVTKLINSYMKRSGADILLKIEENKAPYITYLFNGEEMTQKDIQDEEFRLAVYKYSKSDDKLEQRKVKKKRWWFTWWLWGDGD